MAEDEPPPERKLKRTNSVAEVIHWLKKKLAEGKKDEPEKETPKSSGILPEAIESAYFEHSMDAAGMADLYPLSRISIHDPSSSHGLMQDEASSRLMIEGTNVITSPTRSNKVLYFSQYLHSFRLLLLITAALCLIIFFLNPSAHLVELGISVFVFIVILTMAAINYSQEKWARKFHNVFQSMIAPSCTVMRGGKELHTSSDNLVSGDIVWLKAGMRVPADIRLLLTSRLRLEASWLTGDVNPLEFVATPTGREIPAMQAQNIALHGCSVTAGSAIGVVIRTGNATALGRLVSLASEDKGRRSRLSRDHIHFVRFVCILSLIVGATIFLIGIAISHLTNIVTIFINGFFVVLVANIPQGLPVMITTQLVIVSRRLAKRALFLKKIDNADTLGTTSALLIEKTGILTRNSMTVTELWYDGEAKAANTDHFHMHPSKERLPAEAFKAPLDRILTVMIVCNRAQVYPITREDSEEQWRKASVVSQIVWTKHALPSSLDAIRPSLPDISQSVVSFRSVSGAPLEAALLRFADELCLAREKREEMEVVFEIPFNKQRRWHLAIARRWSDSTEDPEAIIRYQMYVKGAPEELITRCLKIATRHIDRPLNEHDLFIFKEQYLTFGNRGRSCIAFAYLEFEDKAGTIFNLNDGNYPQDGLTFLGMAALVDAPRPDLKSAVMRAKQAKIKLHVVTGDHPSTAAAVAKDVGLIDENCPSSVVVGEMLDHLTPNEWDHLLAKDHLVFARISPSQKQEVVKQLRKRGEVVAVTGDGVLDAPSLKDADVGIAIDAVGSSLAKQAADIVVTDGSLWNILYGIEHGRLLFENLKKAIAYTLTHLLAELLPVLLTFVLGMPLGLNSVQILAIDLVCEIAPGIAMIFEKPERDIMQKPPRKSSSRLVSKALLFYSYVLAGSVLAIGCLFSYLMVYWKGGVKPYELLFTAGTYWQYNSPNITLSDYRILTPPEQVSLRKQACGAWHITLILAQAFHAQQCRTRRVSMFLHKGMNLWMLAAVVYGIGLSVVLVYVPGVNDIMGAEAPDAYIWIVPVVVGVILMTFNETRKFFIRRSPHNRIVRMFKW